jgi:hypothetical protein
MAETNGQPDAEQTPDEPPPASAMEAVTRRFMRYLGEDGSSLTGVWVLISIFNLAVVAFSATLQYKTGAVANFSELMNDPAAMQAYMRRAQDANLLGLLNYPLIVLSAALYYSGFAAMRVIEERPSSEATFAKMRSAMFSQFGSTVLATLFYLIAAGLGSVCCVLPGLIAIFLFFPAPYLATKPSFGASAGFSESIDWLKRHTSLFVVAFITSLLAGIGIGAMQFLAVPVAVERFGDVGVFVANGALWFIGVIIGYFVWMFIGSCFITIDLAEEQLRR